MKQILLLITYLLACNSYAQKPAFDPESSTGQLFQYSEYVDVDKTIYTIEDILANDLLTYKNLESANHDFGFTSDNYWVRFALKNSSNTDKTYYFETGRPVTDIINLYEINTNIIKYQNGDQNAFAARNVEHRQIVFKLTLQAHSEQLYFMEISSDGEAINLPLTLYNESSFFISNYKQQLFLGLFYGVLLLAGFIYLIFYNSLKNKTFLYYGIYVFSIALMQAALDGFIYQYVFPNGGFFNSRMVLITAISSNFFLLKYCEHFLKTNFNLPHYKKAYNAIYISLTVSFVMIFISPKALELAYPICNLNGLFSLILILTTVFTMWYKRISVDIYFSLGVMFLVAGLLGFVMNNLGLLPSNFYTLNSSKFGSGIEVVLLSLSMTKLIKKLRKDNEKAQALALKKSEEISELKTYFMSNISHELRTPINAIMGMAESALSDNNNINENKDKFQIIKNASLSLLSNVNDILDFERIEKNQLHLNKEEFNPKLILKEISNNWKFEANKKELNYSFQMDSEIPTKVSGDPERFTQIINNVLANAVKFTNEGYVHLKLKCLTQPNDISRFYFQISDSGVGMDQESKAHIFDSFNQMRLNNKRQFGGIGLGLTISKHLITLFNGKLQVESIANKGTDVFIEIPLKKVVSALSDKKSNVINTTDSPVEILVVEDNKLNQLVMQKLLSNYPNASITIAENGKQAIVALKTKAYNLVLMDLQMPIMNGYEATAIIRSGDLGELNNNIPIIAVTADATDATKQRVLRLGMNDYMTKPVKKELLFEKMNACINTHNLNVA
ncbi:hybrid sensor histidine kinase/response regulator [Winogradskyella psychrotolerans]|uniref:hybrid sensor histidine kinase/response regulator n=1 Tax=Winogradskyella psychrotolerans TaxID=1344585 RepID=UPI001C07D580|nr:hybrid sensor histidine kinase/response regulator [Winogradskyella psychrotolerans]MBU2926648.1 response regulator [Winogradskyella psychrotolerans]